MGRFALLALFCLASFSCSRRPEFPYQDVGLSVDRRVLSLFPRLTRLEKQAVLEGRAVARLGIPAWQLPAGEPSSGVALAATWDPRIVGDLAVARPSGFGYYGEDPWLAARMAVAWTGAMQSEGRIGLMRGFRCTEDERTRNEIEFPPFRAAVEEAGLWAVSLGDCPLDSATATLDGGWGFRGFVTGGNHSDEQVRRILRALFAEGRFDAPTGTKRPIDPKIARIAAEEGVVLLRNDGGLLPIYASRLHSIRVVGSTEQVNAIRARAGSTPVIEGGNAEKSADADIVFEGTRVQVSEPAQPKAQALLEAWTATFESAQAATDVIFGDVNPSGRLPVTEQRYPFGFGLSYTTFDWSDLRIFPATPRYGQLVQVVVKVRNSGARFGAEVVEAYIHQVKSSVPRPAKELKAFQRVELKPGEARDVALTLDRHSMSFYDPAVKDWAAEPGVFEVLLGSSSGDIRLKGSFQLFQ